MNNAYFEYVSVVLDMQHSKCMRGIILASVASQVVRYNIFPRHHINVAIFVKHLLNMKCVFWFSLKILPELFLILTKTERDIIINVRSYLCKVPVVLVRASLNLKFFDRFSKITQIF
jgi:hypothetical protein